MSTQTYTSDKPISTKKDDRFNRWPFAERIAETIADRPDHSSLIVAIYGAWGDGKTSVLKMMQEHLTTRGDVAVVTFNPWHFETQSELIKAFFQTLADALGAKLSTKVEALGEVLKNYGSVLSVGVPGVSLGGASKLGEALSNVTLDQLRTRIESFMTDIDQRVVVLIDDIDRLDRREIQLVFKLVKLSAGFENTSYVLAFDDEVVADALGERYGAGGVEAGRKFLEKIVQVPLHLPPADQISLRQMAFEGVDAALRSAEVQLSESDAQVLVRRFLDGLEVRLTTPRQAKRFGNALAFAIPILKGEVHPVDQLLIEGIRIFYPEVYEIIRRNPDVFLATGVVGESGDAYRSRVQPILELVGSGLDKREQESIEKLLRQLFPRLPSVLGNMHYGDDSAERWAREQRICSCEYFHRYFRYAIPPRDIGDQELMTFIQTPATAAELERSIARFCAGGGAARFVAKIRSQETTIPIESARRLALAIARTGGAFPVETQMFSRFASTRSQAAILLLNLLKRIEDTEARCADAKAIAQVASPLPFALDWFWWIRPGKDDAEAPVFPGECVMAIGALIASRVREEAEVQPPYLAWPGDAPSGLWVWKTYGEPGAVTSYLNDRFANEPRDVLAFLVSFVPTAWDLETGFSFKSSFQREQYNSAIEFASPQLILQTLRGLYGNQLDNPEYHHSRETPLETRVALQFAYIHAHVVKEAEEKAKAGTVTNGSNPSNDLAQAGDADPDQIPSETPQ